MTQMNHPERQSTGPGVIRNFSPFPGSCRPTDFVLKHYCSLFRVQYSSLAQVFEIGPIVISHSGALYGRGRWDSNPWTRYGNTFRKPVIEDCRVGCTQGLV